MCLARAAAIKYSAPWELKEFGYRSEERKVSLERKFSYRDVACLFWSSSWPRITHTHTTEIGLLGFLFLFPPEVPLGSKKVGGEKHVSSFNIQMLERVKSWGCGGR